MMKDRLRAAAIGSTGRGGFGHGHDVVFRGLEGVAFVALADDDPAGREAAARNAGISRTYADYRDMLAKEKPDLVSIGPRWVDQRVAMVTAAAQAGCHVYCEKPLAGCAADADAILEACRRAGVRIAVAHQLRGMPPVQKSLADLRAGKFGKLVRVHARGKEDHRGGGEDLIVLGTHLMDLMTLFAGPPRWVSGHVAVGERLATRDDRRPATEPVGPIAGNNLSATFGFDNGVIGTFHSRAKLVRPGRSPYGIFLECEDATVCIRNGDVFVYSSSVVVPEDERLTWKKLWIEDWHFYPDHKPRPMNDRLERGNQILVRDLLAAIAHDREPLSSGADARAAIEMIQGVYASHLAGGARTPIPLIERNHPLGRV
jgi:predicted dehydrogenase